MRCAPLRMVVLVALAAALAALAAAPIAGAAERRQGGALGEQLRRITADPHGPPGISVLIKRHGRSQSISSGVANLTSGGAPTAGLRMRIASMSKAFNGAIAMALISEGRLHPDDTIDEVLPGLWPLAGDVTVGQMLQHTGGLPDYIRDPAFIDVLISDPAQYLTPRQLIDFVDDQGPTATPGTTPAGSPIDAGPCGPPLKASPRACPPWLARVRLIRGACGLTLKAASFRT